MTNIYESAVFKMMPGGSMHPGGLRLTDRAVRLAALSAGMRVADIGCGTGSTAAFLTEKYSLNVVGLEISDKLINLGLKRYPGLSLIRRDCQTLCLEYNSLDAIFLECTLSLLGDAQLILEQCARALKKTGLIIISDIYVKGHVGPMHPLTPDALMAALAAAGFESFIQEDHTAALRTFAAGLWEQDGAALKDGAHDADAPGNGDIFAGCFLGASCELQSICLSDLGYMLTIARKAQTYEKCRELFAETGCQI